ncbi:hypothetical protein [Sporosarcina sp. E16_8]|uniref:hypothetical protein n=1 Tax=Sporosarcina sp. E16_8 TaxID=2789295 RepID=UPI001A9160A5|nr:hypothetical protein [Sporosarcina sp. E16_8]MBO0589195.1 hypothetical protein [Sporosarcina sp. E16_8]
MIELTNVSNFERNISISKRGKTIDDEKINYLSYSTASDKDLVELVGYHAYQHYGTDKAIMTKNGSEYLVINTAYDGDSGLDALTVKNIDSNELTIVFVGSEKLKDAVKYFEDINEKYVPVTSVTGNSLPGASANAMTIEILASKQLH